MHRPACDFCAPALDACSGRARWWPSPIIVVESRCFVEERNGGVQELSHLRVKRHVPLRDSATRSLTGSHWLWIGSRGAQGGGAPLLLDEHREPGSLPGGRSERGVSRALGRAA